MDLNGLLRLIFLEKYEVTFGVLIALTLLSVVLLLVRSVMEEKQEATVGGGSRGLDVKSINQAVEGAMKKALSDKSLAGIGEKVAAGENVSGDTAELKKILSEREAKIATLMTDLESVKAQIDGKPKDGAVAASGTDEDLLLLRTKVNELQTKLSEYEIIEDDIADLSIFKEENKKLKDEVEKLRAATSTAQTQVQAAQAAVEAPALLPDPVQVAQAAVTAAPAQEPFELDTNDAVMGEFAQALTGSEKPLVKPTEQDLLVSEGGDTISDPKAAIDAILQPVVEEPADPFGPLDTEKMLAEVQSLSDTGADAPSVLDEQLDTDRLMAEMGMTETAEPAAAPAPEPAVVAAAAPIPQPAPTPVPTSAPAAVAAAQVVEEAEPAQKSSAPVDDLLAEFSDPDFQPGRGTKGS